ncbi:uncharacterized protein BDV14DRAFT_176569 [Aspergillus stella-maris]|uniref:uncharacterized protein n=1 Tax=Aspergillus stella-maris TaxID=1810926 RepID=UPI003CCDBA93
MMKFCSSSFLAREILSSSLSKRRAYMRTDDATTTRCPLTGDQRHSFPGRKFVSHIISLSAVACALHRAAYITASWSVPPSGETGFLFKN